MTQSDLHRRVNFTSTDGKVGLVLDVDSAFVVDGRPWLHYTSNSSLSVPDIGAISQWLFSSASVCPMDQGHWTDAYYDPSIGFLFNAGPESTTPPSNTPSSRKNGGLSPVGIAMISVFVPVLVLLGVAAFVILVVLPKRQESKAKDILIGAQ